MCRTFRRTGVAAAACLSTVLLGPTARAEVIFWDGGANTGNWGDAANWSTDTLPTAADDVVLTRHLPYDAQRVATLHLGGDRAARSVTGTAELQDNGRIIVGSAADVAAGHALALSGGGFELKWAGKDVRILSDIVLGADGRFVGGSRLLVSGAIGDNGSGAGVTTGYNVTLTGANSYGGVTHVTGHLQFAGPDGSARNSRAFVVDGSMTLDSRESPNNDRLNDAAPITLRGGSLGLIAHATEPTRETVGDITLAGSGGGIGVSDGPATLKVRSLARTGAAVGTVGTTAGGRVVMETLPPLVGAAGPAGSTRMSIVPFLSGNYGRPVTYDLGPDAAVNTADDVGLRTLADGEFVAYDDAGADDNVLMTRTAPTPLAGKTIHSLRIDSASPGSQGVAVSGTGTLRIRSGFLSAMYGHYVNVSISGFDAVDFGSAEALISKQVGHGPDGGLVISSPVTGSGGLTKSGFGTLRLKGEHAYTGTTTVIDGVLEVDRASGLGLGGGEGVVLQDYGTVVAAVSFATDRPIVVRPGDSGAVSVHPGQTLTLAAGIRAGGDLAKLGTGTLVLSAPADPASASSVFVSNGTLLLENDTGSATGTGRLHVLPEATLGGNGGTLAPTMVWGNVAPGSPASVGLLSTGNMEMGRGAVLRFDLGDPAASDRISVAGDLTLDGILRIQPLDAFAPGTYRLIDYTGRLTDNGLAIFYTAPPEFAYRIDTASPGRVNLVVVPEPSALALLAAAALITRRRRR